MECLKSQFFKIIVKKKEKRKKKFKPKINF